MVNTFSFRIKKFSQIISEDEKSRLCSAGVLGACVAGHEDPEVEALDDLLDVDCVGQLEALSVVMKLNPTMLLAKEDIGQLLIGSIRFCLSFY